MVMNREFVVDMIAYMKENREMTIAQKCKALGISVPGYYYACQRFGLNGSINPKRQSKVNMDRANEVMAQFCKKRAKAQTDTVTTETTETPKTPETPEHIEPTELVNQHDSGTQKCTQAQDSLE